VLWQEAQKIKALAEEADTVSTEQLRKIIHSTVFAEFEKSELQKSHVNNTIRDVGSILGAVFDNEFFRELENTANHEVAKENQILKKNKAILESAQQKLATLDAGQIWQVLKIYNRRGMWDAINYIQAHH